jgi:hypothetical protein
LQVFVLALIPLVLVPLLSNLIGEYYPASQAAQFGLLWCVIGSAVFAAAFLSSVAFTGEYTALAVSLLAFYLYPLAVRATPLRAYPLHLHYIMNGIGMPYFHRETALLVGHLPWMVLFTASLITLGFIASATLITQRQDFP